ncbi:MAG: hypothetical protein PHG24_00565 [Candidatus Pacebacteria bacterium]|nr:hypothetical protein [Candidatus Paceibacterota bacterium]
MDFKDIKKIVDRDGKVVILEDNKTYIVSRYTTKDEVVLEEDDEDKNEGLKLEDLPF